jgi:predicted RNA binding protein YcfA (HicA-like mRNA interferase family)
MGKLPALKSRDVVRALVRAGFVEHRQRGSHKIFKKGNLRITVPIHNKDLKKGTLFSIIEQAGLTVEEFTELLK